MIRAILFVLLLIASSVSLTASSFTLPFPVKEGSFPTPENLKRQEFTRQIFTQKFYRMPVDFSQPEVRRYISIYKRPHSRIMINRALQRSRPYALFIHQQLTKKGLPEELFLLPIIESEFSNTAKSHVGAAGIWQIMENSMTHSMLISPWRDDRQNFWKSTESALSRLEYNYRILGDWRLSLSAYNAGLGRITGLIRRSGESNYWALARRGILPRDTREYIPKFYAIVYLASHSIQSNLRIHWDRSMDWSLVEIKTPIPLAALTTQTNIPIELLKMGNAELKQNHTPQDSRQFFLKVPSLWRDRVENALTNRHLIASRPLSIFLWEGDFFANYFLEPSLENLILSLRTWEEREILLLSQR